MAVIDTAKILDNARIIRESLASRTKVYAKFANHSPQVVDGYHLILEDGVADDFEGLSLQLRRQVDQERRRHDPVFAKVGFYLDTTNKLAYVSNCQGRLVSVDRDPQARRKQRKLGQEYARFGHLAGNEPRAYVATKLFELLAGMGIEKVRAIRPQEHLMAIGKHPGFRANYPRFGS